MMDLMQIVALRKYIWSTILSREIGKMPRKWRSVRPSKSYQYWTFWARVQI